MPLKFRDILRIIEADGWVMVSQVGSHRQYKHPVKMGRVKVPGKPGDDAHSKLEKTIFKQAQIEGNHVAEYTVIIERSKNNFGAWVPDLGGCVSTGQTEEEVKANIREAIELHLAGMREDGLPIPEPSHSVLIDLA